MTDFKKTIREVDLTKVDEANFKHRFVGCIVLTHDNQFLLQQIVDARSFFPAGSLVTFGGKIEPGESPIETLIRELNEELGAQVNIDDTVYLGAITEEATGHTELIHTYFWHDKSNTITGCYEDQSKLFNTAQEIFDNPKVTDDIRWMLNEIQNKSLIHDSNTTQMLHNKLIDLLDITENQTILDIGCGAGTSISYLLARYPDISKIIGIDQDEASLKQITEIQNNSAQSKQLELIQYDIDRLLPFEANQFDRILCQNVMECIENKHQLINELYRILKPKGKLLLSHHDFDTIVFNSYNKNLTRKLVHCYADTTQNWQKTSDGQIGRKLLGLINRSPFTKHEMGSLVFSESHYNEDAYGYKTAHWIYEVTKNTHLFEENELKKWLNDLEELNKVGAYFFSINLMYVLGIK